jgi:hypothetical protein
LKILPLPKRCWVASDGWQGFSPFPERPGRRCDIQIRQKYPGSSGGLNTDWRPTPGCRCPLSANIPKDTLYLAVVAVSLQPPPPTTFQTLSLEPFIGPPLNVSVGCCGESGRSPAPRCSSMTCTSWVSGETRQVAAHVSGPKKQVVSGGNKPMAFQRQSPGTLPAAV